MKSADFSHFLEYIWRIKISQERETILYLIYIIFIMFLIKQDLVYREFIYILSSILKIPNTILFQYYLKGEKVTFVDNI